MARRKPDPKRTRRRVWAAVIALIALAAWSRQVDLIVYLGGAAALLLLGLALESLARGRRLRRAARALGQGRLEREMQRLGGDDFESFCAELLRRNGARVVEQGGAGDQGADLLIDWQRRRWVVQCKRLGRNVSNAAVQQAHAGRSYHGTQGAMVITNQGFTRSARELAARTDVELIDGQGLARLLRRAG